MHNDCDLQLATCSYNTITYYHNIIILLVQQPTFQAQPHSWHFSELLKWQNLCCLAHRLGPIETTPTASHWGDSQELALVSLVCFGWCPAPLVWILDRYLCLSIWQRVSSVDWTALCGDPFHWDVLNQWLIVWSQLFLKLRRLCNINH